jgi:hypothetical protein
MKHKYGWTRIFFSWRWEYKHRYAKRYIDSDGWNIPSLRTIEFGPITIVHSGNTPIQYGYWYPNPRRKESLMSIANERKWRLMTHKEMEMDYAVLGNEAMEYKAYITDAPENHNDPLYSIVVCDGDNEEHNTLLAMEIIVHLNYEDV